MRSAAAPKCSYCQRGPWRWGCGGHCGKVGYCSLKCGEKDWPRHHGQCYREPGLRAGPFFPQAYQMAVDYRDSTKKLPLFETEQLSGFAMWLDPREPSGAEVHPDATQWFMVVAGSGEADVGIVGAAGGTALETRHIGLRDMVVVPAGRNHALRAGPHGLGLLTIYAPAKHHTVEGEKEEHETSREMKKP